MTKVYTFGDLDFELRTLGIHVHDVFKAAQDFGRWCDDMEYGQTDPVGKDRGSSQIWYAEYVAHPNGNAVRPPRLNIWHWFLDQFDHDKADWIETPQGRYLDVVVTREALANSPVVEAILLPFLIRAGGTLPVRLAV